MQLWKNAFNFILRTATLGITYNLPLNYSLEESIQIIFQSIEWDPFISEQYFNKTFEIQVL